LGQIYQYKFAADCSIYFILLYFEKNSGTTINYIQSQVVATFPAIAKALASHMLCMPALDSTLHLMNI